MNQRSTNPGGGTTRIIAFFLTQFHPIPENDAWWGKGFTEWTNVTKARPLFPGHYQPHLPTDLGFYDLRLRETRREQIALAREYGIDGFCYHYYWFSGRRVLEKPLNDMLADSGSDMPFCLCWANENWTRRWDAAEHEILLSQKYREDDDLRFISELLPIFRDPRYIRHQGKPLLIVYRPQHLPDARKSAEIWRKFCSEAGLSGIHLCAALTHGNWDYKQFGFDSGVEFPPHNLERALPNETIGFYRPFHGHVVDYADVASMYLERRYSAEESGFRTVFPSWDNTARRNDGAVVVLNGTPENYEHWLSESIRRTEHDYPGQDRLVFINAWNEWAEGCHLEPDRKYGRQFLEATLRAKRGEAPTATFPHAGIPAEALVVPAGHAREPGGKRSSAILATALDWFYRGKNNRKELRRKLKKFRESNLRLRSETEQLKTELREARSAIESAVNASRAAQEVIATKLNPLQSDHITLVEHYHSLHRAYEHEKNEGRIKSSLLRSLRTTPDFGGSDTQKGIPVTRDGMSSLSAPWAIPCEVPSQGELHHQSAAGGKISECYRCYADFVAVRPSVPVQTHAGYRAELSCGTRVVPLPARFSEHAGYESAPQAFKLITDALVFTWMGAVMHQPGHLVEESIQAAIEYEPNLATIPGVTRTGEVLEFRPGAIGPVVTVAKPCLLAYHGSALAYGHWWFDVVPSIWLWREQIAQGELGLLMPRDTPPWVRSILDLLDIPEASCIETGEDALLVRQCLVATACSISNLRQPPPVMVEIGRRLIERVCGKAKRTRGRRLYLTRSRSTTHWSRQLENEGELIALLQTLEFEMVDPGAMSITQQIEMFSEAAIVVSPHGSALANLIFAPPGCAVVDLMPDVWVRERSVGWIYDSTNVLGQSYVCLLGETTWQSTGYMEYRSAKLRDRSLRYRIELPALARAIEQLSLASLVQS